MFNSSYASVIIPLRITDIDHGEPSSFEPLRIIDINTTEETIDETIEETDIIEWTTDFSIKQYKKGKSTRDIIKDLAGCRTFELYNSTYPTGIGKHLNCDDIPLLYTVLLFPKEAKYVGVTQDIIDSNSVIKNLCNMSPNMCISNKRYFGRNIVGMNNNPLLVIDLPFTSVFIS